MLMPFVDMQTFVAQTDKRAWNNRSQPFCAGFSYRHAQWLPEPVVFEAKPQLLRNFVQRRAHGEEENDPDIVDGIHPDWLKVHRVIAKKQYLHNTKFLTKWYAPVE